LIAQNVGGDNPFDFCEENQNFFLNKKPQIHTNCFSKWFVADSEATGLAF
jgi:hypothetical protein